MHNSFRAEKHKVMVMFKRQQQAREKELHEESLAELRAANQDRLGNVSHELHSHVDNVSNDSTTFVPQRDDGTTWVAPAFCGLSNSETLIDNNKKTRETYNDSGKEPSKSLQPKPPVPIRSSDCHDHTRERDASTAVTKVPSPPADVPSRRSPRHLQNRDLNISQRASVENESTVNGLDATAKEERSSHWNSMTCVEQNLSASDSEKHSTSSGGSSEQNSTSRSSCSSCSSSSSAGATPNAASSVAKLRNATNEEVLCQAWTSLRQPCQPEQHAALVVEVVG